MTTRLHLLALTIAVSLTAGCNGRSSIQTADASVSDSTTRIAAVHARPESAVRATPGYVIDSILPVEEEIRRFQATLGPAPSRFVGGATSRRALLRAFERAVERNDTTALAKLVVSRAEFGYLVYPSSPNAHPPYRQSPEIVWLTRSAATAKGAARLLARFGGRPLAISGVTCAGAQQKQGENTVWTDCAVTRTSGPGGTSRLRLFGPIVERDGQFKFLTLAGGL